jgi:hypothetical protein
MEHIIIQGHEVVPNIDNDLVHKATKVVSIEGKDSKMVTM